MPAISADFIANVAMTLPADLCVIDVQDQQRLVAACVCAPSYWRLRDKIGQPLRQIHAPVDGMNANLGSRIEHFIVHAPMRKPFASKLVS